MLPLEFLDLNKQWAWLILGLHDLWSSARLRLALLIDHLSCTSFLLSLLFISATKTLSHPVSNFLLLLFKLWVRLSQHLQRPIILRVQLVGLTFVRLQGVLRASWLPQNKGPAISLVLAALGNRSQSLASMTRRLLILLRSVKGARAITRKAKVTQAVAAAYIQERLCVMLILIYHQLGRERVSRFSKAIHVNA